MELKEKISETRQRLASLNTMQQNKDHFLTAVRKFMEMETLTPTLLRELIDHIDVYETQGTGKHRTQRITIFYRFVGYIDIPEAPEDEPYTADTRQGVEEGTSPNWHKNSRHKTCKTRIKAEKTGVHNKSVMNTRNGCGGRT